MFIIVIVSWDFYQTWTHEKHQIKYSCSRLLIFFIQHVTYLVNEEVENVDMCKGMSEKKGSLEKKSDRHIKETNLKDERKKYTKFTFIFPTLKYLLPFKTDSCTVIIYSDQLLSLVWHRDKIMGASNENRTLLWWPAIRTPVTPSEAPLRTPLTKDCNYEAPSENQTHYPLVSDFRDQFVNHTTLCPEKN